MKKFFISIVILEVALASLGYFTIVECPVGPDNDYEYNELKPLQINCTMQLIHCPLAEKLTNYKNPNQGYQVHEYNPDAEPMCQVKFKVNIVKSVSVWSEKENPCVGLNQKNQVLLPHAANCSLFYKCDWGMPTLFQCPEELHFNSILQICDWPWRAGCDLSWIYCPRPLPRCPIYYPRSLLLPHPFLCDQFYQCNWGIPQLQVCPTGLYFNNRLKVCDWPYNLNCKIC